MNEPLKRQLDIDFLKAPSIPSVYHLFVAQNILLLVARQNILTLFELKNFQSDSDYVAKRVHALALSFIKNLTNDSQNLFSSIFRQANIGGLLDDQYATELLPKSLFSSTRKGKKSMEKKHRESFLVQVKKQLLKLQCLK